MYRGVDKERDYRSALSQTTVSSVTNHGCLKSSSAGVYVCMGVCLHKFICIYLSLDLYVSLISTTIYFLIVLSTTIHPPSPPFPPLSLSLTHTLSHSFSAELEILRTCCCRPQVLMLALSLAVCSPPWRYYRVPTSAGLSMSRRTGFGLSCI